VQDASSCLEQLRQVLAALLGELTEPGQRLVVWYDTQEGHFAFQRVADPQQHAFLPSWFTQDPRVSRMDSR
jgi:hypothetical protein